MVPPLSKYLLIYLFYYYYYYYYYLIHSIISHLFIHSCFICHIATFFTSYSSSHVHSFPFPSSPFSSFFMSIFCIKFLIFSLYLFLTLIGLPLFLCLILIYVTSLFKNILLNVCVKNYYYYLKTIQQILFIFQFSFRFGP